MPWTVEGAIAPCPEMSGKPLSAARRTTGAQHESRQLREGSTALFYRGRDAGGRPAIDASTLKIDAKSSSASPVA